MDDQRLAGARLKEKAARRAIAGYARLLFARGLVAGTSGNISVRCGDGTVVVTPSGRALRDLDPDELVAVAPDGTFAGGLRPTSELPLHLAAYRVRPEIACVIHTHPTHVVGWSKTGALFPLDTVGAIESLGTIAFAPYHPSGTQALADACAACFAQPVDTVVMERHGLSSVGTTLEAAFVRTDLAEQTAQLEFVAKTLRAASG